MVRQMDSQMPPPEISTQPPKSIPGNTHTRHLRGWLSYAFASEIFAAVGLSNFLPICLEQFARDNGYIMPGKTIRCPSDSHLAPATEDARCVVKVGMVWIDTASFSLYVFSLSVALQALTVISMGGIADHPPHRKPLLLAFAFLGSISAILVLPLPSSSVLWPFVGLLACAANVGFGVSVATMNSYLPNLAREAPEVRQAWDALQCNRTADAQPTHEDVYTAPFSSVDILLQPKITPDAVYNTALARATSRISSLGVALGYIASIFVLTLIIVLVSMLHSSTFSLRLAVGISGIWWAIFSIPAGLWLPSGTALKGVEGAGAKRTDESMPWSISREVKGSWVRLGRMLRWREIKRLRNTFWFLAAWFLLSDGFATLGATAVLFAKTTLNMPSSRVAILGVISPLAAVVSSLAWPILQHRIGWSDLRILKLCVIIAGLIPLYCCFGFLPVFRKTHAEGGPAFGGMTTEGEMYGLAMTFGLVYGPFQGYSRSFFSLLIPPGEEARWYALYSITDKSSSFVGPLAVGLISDLTGNIRYGFFVLAGMMYLALPLLSCVNSVQGQEDARHYTSEDQDTVLGRGEYIVIPLEDS